MIKHVVIFILIAFPSLCMGQSSAESITTELSSLNQQFRFKEMIPLAKKLTGYSDPKTRASGFYWQGLAYGQTDEFELSLKSYYSALNIYDNIDDTTHVGMVYGEIAIIYYEAHNLKQAEAFTLKAIRHYRKNYSKRFDSEIARNYSNIANFYLSAFADSEDQDQAALALNYYAESESAYQKMERNADTDYSLALIWANRTMLYALTQDERYSASLDKSMHFFRGINDSLQISLLHSSQAHYNVKSKNWKRALESSDSSLTYFPNSGRTVFLIDFYRLRGQILEHLSEDSDALRFVKMADSLEQLILDNETIGNLQNISNEQRQQELIKKHKDRLASFSKEIDKSYSWIYISISVFTLCIIIGLFILFRSRRKRNHLALELHSEKERFRAEIEDFKSQNKDSSATHKQLTSYGYIIEQTYARLTKEESLQEFSFRVKELDISFFAKLTGLHPKLTQKDLTLCTYLIVGMSSKDISQLLSIEPASVDRQRYRLRKKIQLAANENLISYLESIQR